MRKLCITAIIIMSLIAVPLVSRAFDKDWILWSMITTQYGTMPYPVQRTDRVSCYNLMVKLSINTEGTNPSFHCNNVDDFNKQFNKGNQ